jgi:hypothetical protein
MSLSSAGLDSLRQNVRRIVMALICLTLAVGCAWAEDGIAVPHLVKLSGTIAGTPSGSVGAIFALYKDQVGGAPLWQEVQTVSVDATGRYTALLGAGSQSGIPVEVFSSNEAHWLGIQMEGQPEQPRILLVSVPYAMKAADAETLGGLPASAFLRADRVAQPPAYVNTTAVNAAARNAASAAMTSPATSALATAGYLPVFTDSSGSLANSLVAQSSGNVGIGTATPVTTLHLLGTNPTLRMENYGPGGSGDSPNVNYYSANGSSAAPTASLSGDNLGQFAASGYTGSGFPGSKVKVSFVATENWSPTANGTAMSFQTTSNGSTSRSERMRIDNTGYVGIGTSIPTSPLTVAGAIQSTAGGFTFPDGTTQTTAGLSGVVPIAHGGTGSATQNFVDLSSSQTIGGNKSFAGNQVIGGSVAVGGTVQSNAGFVFPDHSTQTTATPSNLTTLSNNLSTNGGVAYTGNTHFTYPATSYCTLGDIVLSINGYGSGALPADGRLLQISQYTAVFSMMGTNFGGDGVKTFALPDLRAFAPKGLQYSICVEGIFPPSS